MTDPTPLSPTAQAIVTAFDDKYENCGQWDDDWQEQCLAAAFRALCRYSNRPLAAGGFKTSGGGVILDGKFILAITAELEGCQ